MLRAQNRVLAPPRKHGRSHQPRSPAAPSDSRNPARRARSGAGDGTCNPQIPDFSDDATIFAPLALHSFSSSGRDSLGRVRADRPSPYPLPAMRGEVKKNVCAYRNIARCHLAQPRTSDTTNALPLTSRPPVNAPERGNAICSPLPFKGKGLG